VLDLDARSNKELVDLLEIFNRKADLHVARDYTFALVQREMEKRVLII
jgi:hypothetical protein